MRRESMAGWRKVFVRVQQDVPAGPHAVDRVARAGIVMAQLGTEPCPQKWRLVGWAGCGRMSPVLIVKGLA